MKDTLVFTGSYTQPLRQGDGQIVEGRGDGVCVFRMDKKGSLTRLSNCETPNPTYLALDRGNRWLYTINELKEYRGLDSSAVSAYEVDQQDGKLTFLNSRLTGGEDACNLSLSPDGGHLIVANYSGGSLSVFPIEPDHSIGRPSCFFQHYGGSVNPLRQEGPHVHQVVIDRGGRYVLATDLGADEVFVYGVDWHKGHLIPSLSPGIRTAPGMGPRLCVFDKTGSRMYLVCELGNVVCVYDYDRQNGSGLLIQTISTLPEGWTGDSFAACVKLHPNGRLLFASNRGHDSIAAYRINENGLLELAGIHPSEGRVPRDFDISPSGEYMVVGNQESDELVIFAINDQSGELTEVGRTACGCVTAVLIADIG